MKFSERSKRGKRRLVSVIGIGIALVVGVLFFIMYIKKDLTKTLADGYDELVNNPSYIPESERIITPAPTLVPNEEEEGSEQVGDKGYVYKYDARFLQKELLSLVGNPNYPYGEKYRGGYLTAGGFAQLFYEEYGEEISVQDVSVGDVGVGSGYTGVCVGHVEGVPLFAYASDKNMYERTYTGVCLGTVRSMADITYYGMYPVAFDSFYDCCNTIGEETALKEKEEELNKTVLWYGDALYDCGRAFSKGNVVGLIDLMPEDVMHQCNVQILPEEFLKFLAGFSSQMGCPEGDYSFCVLDEISNGTTLASLMVACVSLEEDTYLKTYGEWYVTIYRTYDFFPCGLDLNGYIGVCGFVPANEVSLSKDEEGKIIVTREELVYGLTEDKDGRPIYRAPDGSVMYLDTWEPSEE